MPNFRDYELAKHIAPWSVVAAADNAVATAAKAASPSQRHYVLAVDAGYSTASISGILTVKRGTTVIAQKPIHGAGAFDFPYGLPGNVNEAVSAELTASGSPGVLGYVTLHGYSVSEP